MMLTLSGVGRIVSVTLLVLLVALTIPGRLHARVSLRPEFNKRVSWGIDEDVGLARGAKLIEQWKSAGLMPTESRGLLIHYDFGDYCAWHAPREKVFVNSRFRFHGAELKDLVAIRSELQSKPTLEGDSPVDTGGNLKRIADKHGAGQSIASTTRNFALIGACAELLAVTRRLLFYPHRARTYGSCDRYGRT